jgi:hypothetical protein
MLGRFFSRPERVEVTVSSVQGQTEERWYDGMVRAARSHGAYPYVVEGFIEITEAVRRGHAVLIRREEAEVADGVRVFEERERGPIEQAGFAVASSDPVATILSFNARTARFVIQDPRSAVGSVELTPKRLQAYLAADGREVGVALGA